MRLSITIFLLSIFLNFTRPCAALGAMDAEVSEDLQKSDWPALILLLKPKQGQNFEQDLILARAFFSLERRQEALKTLNELLLIRKDERVMKMIELVSSQFFNQDTANIYYDAIQSIAAQKWLEAKQTLDQALVKEPDQGLILLRLIQVEILLGQKEVAQEHLKTAIELNPLQKDLKVFQAKFLMDDKQDNEKGYKDAYRIFQYLKSILDESEQPLLWYLDCLKQLNRVSEINAIQTKVVKGRPHWSAVLLWMLKNNSKPESKETKGVQAQLQKDLKDFEKFTQAINQSFKKDQYLWVGYFSAETIRTDFEKLPK